MLKTITFVLVKVVSELTLLCGGGKVLLVQIGKPTEEQAPLSLCTTLNVTLLYLAKVQSTPTGSNPKKNVDTVG